MATDMKPNELRIGNYFIDWDNKISVLDKSMFYSIGCGDTSYDEFKPIPLTEEWLLKFGFEKTQYYWLKKYIILNLDFEFCTTNGEGDLTYIGNGVSYKYVHQLQNLYFALTGEELILNKGK